MKSLEIQDDDGASSSVPPDDSLAGEEEDDRQVEVHILQSGQIEFSAPSTSANIDSSNITDMAPSTISSPFLSGSSNTISQEKSSLLKEQEIEQSRPERTRNLVVNEPAMVTPLTSQLSPIKEPPLIIRRNHHSATVTPVTKIPQDPTQQEVSLPETACTMHSDSTPKRRHSERTSNKNGDTRGPYNLRQKQKLSPTADALPSAKRTRHSDVTSSTASETQTSPELGRGEADPSQWTVEEVITFISNVPHCDYSHVFREHVCVLYEYPPPPI